MLATAHHDGDATTVLPGENSGNMIWTRAAGSWRCSRRGRLEPAAGARWQEPQRRGLKALPNISVEDTAVLSPPTAQRHADAVRSRHGCDNEIALDLPCMADIHMGIS